MAALAHHVPGKWVGARRAVGHVPPPGACSPRPRRVLDHVDGRPLHPRASAPAGSRASTRRSGSRCRRCASGSTGSSRAVDTIRGAVLRRGRDRTPGVTRDDPFYPLDGATNDAGPADARAARRSGSAARSGAASRSRRATAEGWLLPGTEAGDVAYFAERRDAIPAALEAAGRDPATFDVRRPVSCGVDAADRASALDTARALVGRGRDHVILGMPATSPGGLAVVADEVAEPCWPRPGEPDTSVTAPGRRRDPARRRGRRAAAAAYVAIRNEATPEEPTRSSSCAWARRDVPGRRAVLLSPRTRADAVGTASAGRIYMTADVRALVARPVGARGRPAPGHR